MKTMPSETIQLKQSVTEEFELKPFDKAGPFTGFVRFFGLKIQGLFKDFQGHIFHFSRTPRTAKSKDVQLLIVAIVPS